MSQSEQPHFDGPFARNYQQSFHFSLASAVVAEIMTVRHYLPHISCNHITFLFISTSNKNHAYL